LDQLKQDISTHAIKKRWKPDQVQRAEDYIDAIRSHGISVRVTAGLDAQHAQVIRGRFALGDG